MRFRRGGRSRWDPPDRADLVVVPQVNGRLADGTFVEGNVRAWLFGMRLLRVRADLVLLPVELRQADQARVVRSRQAAAGGHLDSTTASGGEPIAWPERNGQVTLGDAYRLLRETDGSLQRARGTADAR